MQTIANRKFYNKKATSKIVAFLFLLVLFDFDYGHGMQFRAINIENARHIRAIGLWARNTIPRDRT
ncbi:hypothetical protein FPG59_15795 [Flavobacterium sp. FPG59]|nr:hypothetical protein FPG59_15795 [Flavobacterium sp. FPG59]